MKANSRDTYYPLHGTVSPISAVLNMNTTTVIYKKKKKKHTKFSFYLLFVFVGFYDAFLHTWFI